MPIISQIGRKHPKTRFLIACIYIGLIVGAATMVYPFLLMISGSFKSGVDREQWDVVPRYFYDDAALFQKFVESKYNETLADASVSHRATYFSFQKIQPPPATHPGALADWEAFLTSAKLPEDYRVLGFVNGVRVAPQNVRLFIKRLQSLSGGDTRRFNEKYGTTYERWSQIKFAGERWTDRHYQPIGAPLGPLYREVRATRPDYEFYVVSLDGDFLERQIYPRFGKLKIESVNQAYGTNFTSYADIFLPPRRPANEAFAKDWEQYVRTLLHPRYVRMDATSKPVYEEFARKKYETIEAYNSNHGTRHHTWSDIPLPSEVKESGVNLADYSQFIESVALAEAMEIVGPEFLYREFLEKKYGGDLPALNRAHGLTYTSFSKVSVPALEYDWQAMLAHRNEIRREFIVRNYAIVLDYLLLHGRALWNTVWFCALSILTALIINPLAAYALSRYQLPSQYKILFFLMATMAFPAEVTLIPGFLLLKDLDMLNTFWALILPGAANGYAIFLLKGFFDSLPRELYESAMIDGAGEWRMFWGITMTLSKPILAVIALGAFTGAYGAFMFALLVCQDEKMWTIMVYLYQLQQNFSQPVVFASLLVAAVPTLLVFVFCQNIIMRGIVVPVEK
jgi:multiple sugar transport system permease protein